MRIEALEVFHFRNLLRQRLTLNPGLVVFEGANGQGKTNFLEALYVCATAKSFRLAKPRELIRHDCDHGWLRARFQRQEVRHDVEVDLQPRRRVVRVDERLLRGASSLLELVNVVAFFPDDLRIAKGSPEERRRFLDRAIANHRADFVEASIGYLKALKARNALLRRGVHSDLLAAYDQQLIEFGTTVHQCRAQILEQLTPLAAGLFARIMHSDMRVNIELHSGISGDFTRERFAEALAQSSARDQKRGMTHVGPHRADLGLFLEDQPARRFASQGQQRALVLSLKLAEALYLKQHLGCSPLLLLDDVSSELDSKRTELLFGIIAELGGQAWITTTAAGLLPLAGERQLFTISDGSATEV